MKKLTIKKSDLRMLLFGAYLFLAFWFCGCTPPALVNDTDHFEVITKAIQDERIKADSIEKAYNDSMFPAILKPDSL